VQRAEFTWRALLDWGRISTREANVASSLGAVELAFLQAARSDEVLPAWAVLFWVGFTIVFIIAYWAIFTKAGQPGWASLIPIYNVYVLLKIVGRPWWWLLLLLIPFINFIVGIMLAIDLAKSFGRSTLFGVVMLFFFSAIGVLILAFGSSRYVGPAAASGVS
jgi:hypothetical protein